MSGLPRIVSEVNVTDEDRSAVLENANTQHTDNDRDRTHDEQITSSKVGLLGERLFKQAIERTDGLTFESAKTEKVDGYINTHPVEVKTRKTWNYSNPDLLVRMNFDLEAKFYLQVDLYTENIESDHKKIYLYTYEQVDKQDGYHNAISNVAGEHGEQPCTLGALKSAKADLEKQSF